MHRESILTFTKQKIAFCLHNKISSLLKTLVLQMGCIPPKKKITLLMHHCIILLRETQPFPSLSHGPNQWIKWFKMGMVPV